MLVTAGLRESERSKANRRKPDTQVTISSKHQMLRLRVEEGVISKDGINILINYYCNTFSGIGGDDISVLFQTKQGKKSLQEPWRIDDGQSDLTNKTSSTEIQLIATTET